MKSYSGGATAPDGMYFNPKQWEFVRISHDKMPSLPGGKGDSYHRVWAWLIIIAGPVFGLVFVILLPLIGIGALIGYTGYRIIRGTRSLTKTPNRPA